MTIQPLKRWVVGPLPAASFYIFFFLQLSLFSPLQTPHSRTPSNPPRPQMCDAEEKTPQTKAVSASNQFSDCIWGRKEKLSIDWSLKTVSWCNKCHNSTWWNDSFVHKVSGDSKKKKKDCEKKQIASKLVRLDLNTGVKFWLQWPQQHDWLTSSAVYCS